MTYYIKNIIFPLLVLFILNSCQNPAELTMERGIQYYEWNKFDYAILEFKKVVHLFSNKTDNLNYDQIIFEDLIPIGERIRDILMIEDKNQILLILENTPALAVLNLY